MKRTIRRVSARITASVLACAASHAVAQVEVSPKRIDSAPVIAFDIIATASEEHGKSRLDMYVQMPHQEIHFAKEGEQYVGRYDIALTINTPNQEQVWEKNEAIEVRVKDFASTVSDRLYSLKQLTTDIEPGNYEVNLQVHDEDSKTPAKIRRSVLVTNFYQDSLAISDIMLVSRFTTNGDRKTIVPNISGNIGDLSAGFFLFCELYSPLKVDSFRITTTIVDDKKVTLFKTAQSEPAAGFRTQAFVKISDVTLPIGSYLVLLEATPVGGVIGAKTAAHAASSRTFYVHWSDVPMSILDLDKAIDQMRYIAKESEMDFIRAGATTDEKKRRFIDYWGKRDPDPSTPRNELMEEYYQRIDYANKNFASYLEGWRTDRGMVYIRFGAPENVERHPFDSGTRPYEVWYYYQQSREFIFVDETGFGDYRLRYPTTDLWGRVR